MAGNGEFIELGRLILQSELDVVYIKDLRIEEQVNEHGRMTVRFLSRELSSPEDILRYQGSRVCLATMEGEIVFCGQCTEIGLISANAYQEIELTAYTLSIQTESQRPALSRGQRRLCGMYCRQESGVPLWWSWTRTYP